MIRRVSLCLLLFGAAAQAQTGVCGPLASFVIGDEGLEGATCTTSRLLGGGASKDCYWSFDFRSDAARAWFEDHAKLLRHCADGPVTQQGARVNHPDSFDQLTAHVENREVSLSLKDKGALSQTLVFLRVAQP
ncbi:MAG: hypothetical protein OXC60_16375 [Litoreibacter sp.]|nr:hypothetical protein [Litoreibacter sp.]